MMIIQTDERENEKNIEIEQAIQKQKNDTDIYRIKEREIELEKEIEVRKWCAPFEYLTSDLIRQQSYAWMLVQPQRFTQSKILCSLTRTTNQNHLLSKMNMTQKLTKVARGVVQRGELVKY